MQKNILKYVSFKLAAFQRMTPMCACYDVMYANSDFMDRCKLFVRSHRSGCLDGNLVSLSQVDDKAYWFSGMVYKYACEHVLQFL